MPLSPPVERELHHTRHIEAKGYARSDGLFDLEAHLVDTKTYDKVSPAVTRYAGEPIHDMAMRITIDGKLNITAVEASFKDVPYTGTCEVIAPVYEQLIGQRIAPGFTALVRDLFANTAGCTHMTSLIGILATLAYQTVANRRAREAIAVRKPFQFDRCHALATDGPIVAKFWPQWSRPRTDEPNPAE